MNKLAGVIGAALVSIAVSGTAHAQQEPGRVGSGPPEDFTIDLTRGDDGVLVVSQTEIRLAWGGYYRMNLICPGDVENEAGVEFHAPEFLQNMHIRIVSVAQPEEGQQRVPEVNFHMQGLNLRQIDCEGLGAAARISFHPMRRGTYPFTIVDDAVDPAVEVTGAFIVE
ncbi:MAG: hypothetical protein KIS96_07020 [Bauldia sp.]|nr:hypothetical protein [Bauldia sp.]